MNIKAVLFFVVCLCCVAVRPTNADFFDSSKWYLSPDQWVLDTSDDPANHIAIQDTNNQLQFTANNAGAAVDRWYDSKWSLKLDRDFDVSVNYNVGGVSQIDPSIQGGGQLELGFGSPTPTGNVWYWVTPKTTFSVDNGYVLQNNTVAVYGGVGEHVQAAVDRISDSGLLNIHYDSVQDKLFCNVTQYSAGGPVSTDFNSFAVSGLRSTQNVQELFFNLDGSVINASFSGGENYFQDLKVAVVTPEPASMLLFGVGGAAMALRRFRHKKA